MRASLVRIAIAMVALSIPSLLAAQWTIDDAGPYSVAANGDVLRVFCDQGRLVAVWTTDGSSSSTSIIVTAEVGSVGFRGDWRAQSGLGVVVLTASTAAAEELVRLGRPGRTLLLRVGSRRTTFGLNGFTRVTNSLSCTSGIREREAKARAEAAKRATAQAALADSLRAEREATERERAAVAAAAEEERLRQVAERRAAQAEADRLRAEERARVAREQEAEEAAAELRAQEERQARATAPALWLGAEIGATRGGEETLVVLSPAVGVEWRRVRLAVRPVDFLLLAKQGGGIPHSARRYSADARIVVPVRENGGLSFGAGVLSYVESDSFRRFALDVEPGDPRPYLLFGYEGTDRLGLRAGLDLRVSDDGVELLLNVFGAFR